MRRAHTVEQVRAAEQPLLETQPHGALMARAATGLAVAVTAELHRRRGATYGARVLLLVGPGNNGGDALHAGAWLARRGVAVRAVALGPALHPEGLAAFTGAGGRVVALAEALRFHADLVLDGIVGIGGSPGLRPDAAAALEALSGVPVVAVDLPSGVDVDTGETPLPHVEAALTVTFGTHKVATLVDPAARACGRVELVDIGLELPAPALEALEAYDVARLLPVPGATAHKYTRGVVGVRAGSSTYPGAALLCVAGASSGMAGMVRFVGPDAVADRVRGHFPEVVGPGRVQAWAVGSGGDADAEAMLRDALADDVPVVVDADALAHLHHSGSTPRHRMVLTPHAGELAALVGESREEVEAAPLRHARRIAGHWQAVVLLKGARTLVVHPDGRARVNTTGTPWLATAGSGDVLTGLVGSLLASGLDPFDAASVGAWLHGEAGSRAAESGPVVATTIARHLTGIIGEVTHRM
ncbi:NAD(P)H-hydrate dehydratase [Nocardioides daphniae]|uniref:Bifunctional NAD(P)H-hydrate repair enzyme n=1 Tax=Nocardioides daphniae TaxID=402297 RepID=A0A4P7UD38_9ACTN|nr:NAD(P)H-hydrate dehydratase [Nocardioides daphniae]QCC77976.1 NAD(P)H-hydrate dehydratase [Nocardioides daphniae]GGD23427.1 bifunctional NAD(P)H-hydrate repair enzyme [Nocardioides daphniae]